MLPVAKRNEKKSYFGNAIKKMLPIEKCFSKPPASGLHAVVSPELYTLPLPWQNNRVFLKNIFLLRAFFL